MADNVMGSEEQRNSAEEKLEHGAERLGQYAGRARETVDRLRHNVGDKVHEGSKRLHDAYDRVADTSLHDVQDNVGNYIRQKPAQSLLMAAAAGFILGMCFRRH